MTWAKNVCVCVSVRALFRASAEVRDRDEYAWEREQKLRRIVSYSCVDAVAELN